MARPIKMTEAIIQQLTEEFIKQATADFQKALGSTKAFDGEIKFQKKISYSNKNENKVSILFEPIAYAKMLAVMREFDKEVAWHGYVQRIDERDFLVTDILVYPQTVTGSTVTTDQERYQQWLMELDDETFNTLHLQGHSHVNMSTSPSSVDLTFYDSIISQLGDEDYYIFMILNKKLELFVKVYDMKSNTLYENKDVEIGIHCDGGDLKQFIIDARDDVIEQSYVYKTGVYQSPTTPTTSSKDEKKKEERASEAEGAKAESNITHYPGYYGVDGGAGYSGAYGRAYGADGTPDYDAMVFGDRYTGTDRNTASKRERWWQRT